jgi:hypothetical protein
MPRYESDENRRREQEIADAAARASGMAHQKLGDTSYVIDRAFYEPRSNHVLMFAEIKDRNIGFGFDDLGCIVSVHKVAKGLLLQNTTGVPAKLVACFRDGDIWSARLTDYVRGKVMMFGDSRARDHTDFEPCMIFPWSAFTRVNG